MSKVNEVANLYKQLKVEWNTANPNLSKCEKLLSDLKVGFTFFYLKKFAFLFLAGTNTFNVSSNIKCVCL